MPRKTDLKDIMQWTIEPDSRGISKITGKLEWTEELRFVEIPVSEVKRYIMHDCIRSLKDIIEKWEEQDND